jgi:hypothetical protein
MYSASESNSNEYDNCDCLRTNPLFFTTDKCRKSLNQDSFNDYDETSKRSIYEFETGNDWNDWSFSSSVNTLESFSLTSIQVIK